MQVDMAAGTLKFWVDGKPYNPGSTSEVTGSLRWATTVTWEPWTDSDYEESERKKELEALYALRDRYDEEDDD